MFIENCLLLLGISHKFLRAVFIHIFSLTSLLQVATPQIAKVTRICDLRVSSDCEGGDNESENQWSVIFKINNSGFSERLLVILEKIP